MVLDRLQKTSGLADIPVIVLTARDAEANEQNTLRAGATAFFQKPADNNLLLDLIRATLPSTNPGAALPS